MSDDARAQLAEYRASIDNIDAALIHMLAERFRITKAVGAYKAENRLPPSDPGREERQIARLHALTQSLREYAQGLSPVGVAQREGR